MYFIFIYFLVISGIRVNHVPLSPSWSYLEVAEFQTEPEFPGGTLPSSTKQLRHGAAKSLGPMTQKGSNQQWKFSWVSQINRLFL